MRRSLYLFCLVLMFRDGYAQPTRYGNEWIDYSKTYYKVYVSADGIYRIPYSLLDTIIPNLASVNPLNFIMYHNGLPVPIYVSAIGRPMDSLNDYVEFYGRENIGDVDSVLYFQPGFQPHIHNSMFDDTSTYFLTINNQTNNPRFTFVSNDTAVIPTLTLEPYFMYTSFLSYEPSTSFVYCSGKNFYDGADYLYKSIWDQNEGWGAKWIYYNHPFTYTIPTNSVDTSGPPATFFVNIFTRTWEYHSVSITLDGTLLQTLNYDNTAGGFCYNPVTQQIPASRLLATNTILVSEASTSSSTEEHAVEYTMIVYPRLFQFNNATTFDFTLQPAGGSRYINVNNFNDGGTMPLLYDLTNNIIIQSTDAAGTFPKKYVLPPSAGTRELYLRDNSTSTYTVLTRMDTVTFRNYTAPLSQGTYLVITNRVLRSDSMGHDWVQDYVNYRDRTNNPSSGRYDARLFDIDQLYDQFGYGVKKSPLAIRNFIEYAYDHWAKKPQYLFVIGKGIDYYTMKMGISGFPATASYNQCLIPTFGYQPSDNLLACRRGSSRPLVAVGRLAARKGADVEGYFNKIKSFEALQNEVGDPHQNKSEKLWMKQILHLSGGETSDEEALFGSYLQGFASFATDTSWGANVSTIYKTTSNPIDNSQANIIRAFIDTGLSLMTFFGHAAATAFDISIDVPEVWTNYTKFPMIYSNGCYAGGIDAPDNGGVNGSFSERFVLTPGKAAIGFTATSDLSVSTGLDEYGNILYQDLCQNHYTKPWGAELQYAQNAMDSLYGNGIEDFSMIVTYEMTLHGDPAIVLNQYNLPDYQIDQSSVSFNPPTITASTDSFQLNVIVANLGKAIKDSIQIRITRSFPDPNNPANTLDTIYNFMVRGTYFLDTFSFKLPSFIGSNKGFGQNYFTVFVESQQKIVELSETNNGESVKFGLYIESDDVLPIYPYEFAIIPKQGLTVKASTVDPFAKYKNYRLELDTSALFRHPLAQTIIGQVGGVIHWKLPVTFNDSTVYYWRVSRDSTGPTLGFLWHVSSFLYLKNEYPGWNQSHYYQYQRDSYNDNIYLGTDRVFRFVPSVNNVSVTTGWCHDAYNPNTSYAAANVEWDFNSINEYRYRMGGCGYAISTNGGFTFAVIDTITNNIWASSNTHPGTNYGQFGNYHCSSDVNFPEYGFDFSVVGNNTNTGLTWSKTIQNFLDTIPKGCIVVMYAVSVPPYTSIDTVLINKLAAMGATGLRLLANGMHASVPYIFYCQKGNPAFSGQAFGTSYNVPLTYSFNYNVLWNKGTYVTPNIGPSSLWGSFHWKWKSKERPSEVQQSVDIVGVQNNGTQSVLANVTSLDTTLSFVNARTYPYIYLRMHAEDDTMHMPSQLYYWRVLYKTVPEAAINPAAHFLVQRDTVNLGDSLNVEIAIENVSELPMDSIRTLYTQQGQSNGYQQSIVIKQDSLRAFDTLILKYKQPVTNTALGGNDRLVIEANPLDQLHQPEEYHFNNFAVVNFSAIGDNINPLLNVTFDGRQILNGDIVSAKPDVIITMRDNNQYLALNDTGLAQVYVRYPGQQSPTLIHYDNNILTFYPATGNIAKRNEARIEFKPTFTVDGTYDLLVRDRDVSGNYSSNTSNRFEGTSVNGVYYDYKITFNVITKSMITNVLNYPNPFSTRTQFVFTLTGSEMPSYMKIQIMTITGKVVKEITQDQLGPIHIGTNLTEYYWDGRDQYNDKLANGVYFYRVITDIGNKQADHMSTSTYGQFFNSENFDQYFKHGFGKMVIMR